ncbi:mucin-2-like [Malaya genurostris]|uniref:mucin-2-like n=1 Tax=Malaya genurostris TaxID=325434 RepID=UPI0026F3B59E|nr:mucin-2-like [Malaya genurostris]
MATQTMPSSQTSRGTATNPQLKSLVYSKYRELLGSYNGKANEILQSYPAHMVKEDKGFGFTDNYGGSPQSTIGNSARRIQAQLPAEPPACVQNAMMRRDKQPFTYTPGGIDLSQIKSPRMAKRISRNAQSEGVSGQPKISPLAQNNNNSSSTSNGNNQQAVSPAATLGAAAMGMPFQVFPTEAPAPPPPPPPPSMNKRPTPIQTNGNGGPVPPPPPPPPALSAEPTTEKKTRIPQTFEPPPMGCRPEIKIPPNPIANLRKAPRPQPRNDFWIEEYRNEKLNEMPDRTYNAPVFNSREADEEVAKNTQNRTDELSVRNESPKKRSPSPSNLTKLLENGSRGSSIKTPPVYSQSPVPASLPPPITPTKVSQPPSETFNHSPETPLDNEQSSKARQVSSSPISLSTTSNGTNNGNKKHTNNTEPAITKPPTAQKPAPQPLGSLYIPPAHEVFANSKQTLLNQTSPPWMSSRQNSLKEQPEWVHKEDPDFPSTKSQVSVSCRNESPTKVSETIATAPPSPAKSTSVSQQQASQLAETTSTPHPNDYPAISQTHYIQLQNPATKIATVVQQVAPVAMPGSRSYAQTPVYVQNQMYSPQLASPQKERIIPIQIEQSPIKTPASAPNFAPPPYYNPGPQYSVQSPITVGYPIPHSGYTTPTAMFSNPNHFVNQGYNNITYQPPSPQHQVYQQPYQHQQSIPQQHQHMMSQQPRGQQQTPTQQQQQQQPGGVRIIPIKVENTDNGVSSTNVRGPLSKTPAVIQSDPRSSSNSQSWNGNATPNQSRSFRVLQQITDTMQEADPQSKPSTPGLEQQQQRQTGSGDAPDSQLRRMQLNNEDKAMLNRVKTQVDGETYLHNEEDPRYRGSVIPSKAFRYLQNITEGSQPSSSADAGPVNRANQMYAQNRGNFSESEDDTVQQYIPPSEQKVEEPKKYTGSAIPSRSFKILQAMTQSDAPADSNSSDTEGNQNLPCSGEIRYSPYPYPPQTHYCCYPNWHYYDPSNPQYYSHPPLPPPTPIHASGYYYPPPSPHGHYDRGGFYAGYISPHHLYYPQEPCSPCTPPPYYQIGQPQFAYYENVVPDSPNHTFVIATPPPRIVVTPTPEDSSDVESILSDLNNRPYPLTRSQSSLKRLSERLANFSASPEIFLPTDQDPPIRCSPSSPLNERYRTFEESTSSAPSPQSVCSDPQEEVSTKSTDGTQENTILRNGVQKEDSVNPDEDEDDSNEESEDEETVGNDDNPPEHLPHQLSVIFEEESNYSGSANPSRRSSVCSNTSTLSDCSSTLANDLDADEQDQRVEEIDGNNTDDDIDHLEDADTTAAERSHDKQQTNRTEEQNTLNNATEDSSDEYSETDTEEEGTEEEEEEEKAETEVTSNSKKSTKEPESNKDSVESEESESEDTDESEKEIEEDQSEKPISGNSAEDNGTHTDVTVTITIPSASKKTIDKETDRKDEKTEQKFSVDYEDDAHVSVSVSLPLKLKSTNTDTSNDTPKETDENNEQRETTDGEMQQDEDEEIDFWSQIGEEDEFNRPSRSYSRDYWSSREVSIDRDGDWNQDEDDEHHMDDATDFWKNENGPNEAIDLWKADSAVETILELQNNEGEDSIDFWQSENERIVNDLYKKREHTVETGAVCSIQDENNNSSTWIEQEPILITEQDASSREDRNKCNSMAEISTTVKQSTEPVETESSEEESDDDSEEYETTNTSKEESDMDAIEICAELKSTEKANLMKTPDVILKKAPPVDKIDHKCNGILELISTITRTDDKTLSVREKVSIFENQSSNPAQDVPKRQKTNDANNRLRPPSAQKQSCEESEAEDDSGVTSDISKHISEVETDSECFPEMRKMTRYQRAATHSRLFQLLQDESNNGDSEDEEDKKMQSVEYIELHNEDSKTKSINSSHHPKLNKCKGSSFEDNSSTSNTATDRRDRLSLPIRHQSSSGIDSLSSSTSSASPVSGVTNEKLAEELVLSLLMKKKGRLFRNLPLEKLHAAALKILQEDLESNATISSNEDNITTVDSTPALTPQEFKSEYQNSYSDYYDTWSDANGKSFPHDSVGTAVEPLPSKTFRNIQEHTANRKPSNCSVRCPRVLSNKSISRLAEVRESDAPECGPISRSRPPSRTSVHSLPPC